MKYIRILAKFIGIVCSLTLIVWGAHGLYAYFYPMEMIFNNQSAAHLFGAVTLPAKLVPPVVWMSIKGAQSWYMPGLILTGGIIIWIWQSKYDWD